MLLCSCGFAMESQIMWKHRAFHQMEHPVDDGIVCESVPWDCPQVWHVCIICFLCVCCFTGHELDRDLDSVFGWYNHAIATLCGRVHVLLCMPLLKLLDFVTTKNATKMFEALWLIEHPGYLRGYPGQRLFCYIAEDVNSGWKNNRKKNSEWLQLLANRKGNSRRIVSSN